ncbi:MAG: T9SS type A sorting domain-containing protein, partial [Bacteroidia bacterium]|nr:T9SS type A sorting domain-containing protein [Bacteroidia bacterium]
RAMRVYPNPAGAKFTIEFECDLYQNYSVKITDLTGRIVIKKDDFTSGKITMDSHLLSPGIYIISISGMEVSKGKVIILCE